MDQEMIFNNLVSKNAIHQPVVICIDTSDSMGMDAGNGQTKLQMVEDLVNSLKNVDLSETEKNVVDGIPSLRKTAEAIPPPLK